jgi:hypothetical protein
MKTVALLALEEAMFIPGWGKRQRLILDTLDAVKADPPTGLWQVFRPGCVRAYGKVIPRPGGVSDLHATGTYLLRQHHEATGERLPPAFWPSCYRAVKPLIARGELVPVDLVETPMKPGQRHRSIRFVRRPEQAADPD